MQKPTVLILAYHFPPDPAIGAARPFRFYKYLSRLGYSCKVITAWPQSEPQKDVTYIPNPFETSDRKGWEWQLERALRWSLLPGKEGMSWARHAVRAARDMVRKMSGSPITIFSTFPPLGVHLAAWWLARTEGLPWIADFRDPLGARKPTDHTLLQRGITQWLERTFFHTADAVIANTDTAQQFWQQLYPKRATNIHVLWNGFDPENRLVAKPLPKRPYKLISHVGSLYADRTVGPILASIDRLIKAGRLDPASIRVRLVGSIETPNLGAGDVVARAQAQGWLDITMEAIPQPEAHALMETSDYLLLSLPYSDVQVSAKLFDYLQVGRPILAYVRRNSPAERMLEKSNVCHRCLYLEDSPDRMDQVMMEFLSLPPDVTPASAWFEENFNGEGQTQQLAELIEKTSHHRRGSE